MTQVSVFDHFREGRFVVASGSYEIVHLFTVSGHTFTFKTVDLFTANEDSVSFRYMAQSDGRQKWHRALCRNLAGYSVAPIDNGDQADEPWIDPRK